MIRAVLLLLLVVSAATLLGLAVAEHSGYVLIAWKGLRYESSLWVFLLLLALAWGLFVGVRWLVRVLLASGGVVNPWSRRNRGKRQQLAADKGLLDLIEGRWERAVRHLSLAAEGERQPLMYYLGAARAAHKLGRVEEGEALLEKALRSQPQAELAVALTHAELQRERGDLDGALETLQAMRERHPRHHAVLEQLQRTLVERGDWAALLDLLPELRKSRVVEGEALAELERKAWIDRLQRAGEQGLEQGELALQPLTAAWQQLSSAQRQDAELLLAYARQLRALGAQEEAEEVLRKALKQGLRRTSGAPLRPAARTRPGAPAADRRGAAQAASAGATTAPCLGASESAERLVGQGARILRDQPGVCPQPRGLRRAGAPAGQPGRG